MALFQQGQALLIGIADYKHIAALPDAVTQDVHGIYQLLIDPLRCGYPFPNVQTLLDAQATKSAILAAFDSLAGRCDQDSTAFIYFSGHGASVDSGVEAGQYLLPVDVEVELGDVVASTAISHDEFTACLDKIPARRVVVFFDCCHAGGIGTLKSGQGMALKNIPDDYYLALSQGEGRAIFASSRADEVSRIMPGAGNSLFTQVLMEGLQGQAGNEAKGTVRVMDLHTYISEEVVKRESRQHPVFKSNLEENFAVARYQSTTPLPLTPTLAVREAEATLRFQTSKGLSDHIAVEVARIEGRPSVEDRVMLERRQVTPPSLEERHLGAMFLANLHPSNEQVENYLKGIFRSYLVERDSYLDNHNRLLQVRPVLMNEGSRPATEVALIVDFSQLGETVLESRLPKRPRKPPRPKGQSLMMGLGQDNYSYLARLGALQTPMVHKRRETEPFQIGKTTVEWRIRHLQHRRPVVLEPLFLLVHLPSEASSTLEVPFEIHATEFVEPKQGKLLLDVDVRALDWQVAEEKDLQNQVTEENRDDDEDDD